MAKQHTRASVAYLIAGLVALAFAVIGLTWYFRPEAASRNFGVELPDDDQMAFAYIKGMQDVIAAVLIGVFAQRRDRWGTMLVLIAVAVVPIGDVLAPYLAGASADALPLTVNAVLLVALLTGAFLLGSGRPADGRAAPPNPGIGPRRGRGRPIVPEWLPRTRGKVAVLVVAAVTYAAITFGFTSWWFIDPVSLSSSMGAELSGTRVAYGYIKGFENMFMALAVIMFLVRRRRVELTIVLAVSLLIVIGDQLAQALAGVFVPQIFVAHVTYLGVIGAAVLVLRAAPPPHE